MTKFKRNAYNPNSKINQTKSRFDEYLKVGEKNITKLFAFAGVGLLVGIGCTFYSHLLNTGTQEALTAETQKINGLQNKIDVQKAANSRKVKKAEQAITGLDYVRKDKDDATIDGFLNTSCTWNNAKQYRQMRDELIHKYGLSKNSTFMKTFVPSLAQIGMKPGDDGTNKVDYDGLDMKYEDKTSYVTGIGGSDYSYFAIVHVLTKNKKGSIARGIAIFRYTIDSNQKIKKLDAAMVGADHSND